MIQSPQQISQLIRYASEDRPSFEEIRKRTGLKQCETCVTNDLIWRVPFALILKHVWVQHLREGDKAALPAESPLLAEEGDGTQMTGVLLLRNGGVVRRFLHATAADRTDCAPPSQHPAMP